MTQDLDQIISESHIYVKAPRFAYLKMTEVPAGHYFMVTQDPDEVTVVATEEQCADLGYLEDTKWFKLLEIKVSQPFVAKGFLAAVTKCVANEGLNILIISTYSKDYALVREETANEALQALERRGFQIFEDKT